MLTPSQRKEKLQTVLRVSSGNFLEMYDFMVFGYSVPPLAAPIFLPAANSPR